MGVVERNREYLNLPEWNNTWWHRENFISNHAYFSDKPFIASRTYVDDLTRGGALPGWSWTHSAIESCEVSPIDLLWSTQPVGDLPVFSETFDYINPGSVEADWGEWFPHFWETLVDPGNPGEMTQASNSPALDGRQVLQVQDTGYFGQCSGDRLAVMHFTYYDVAHNPGLLEWWPMVTSISPLTGGQVEKCSSWADFNAGGAPQTWGIRIEIVGTGANTVDIRTYWVDRNFAPGQWLVDNWVGVPIINQLFSTILGCYLHEDEFWLIFTDTAGVGIFERQIFGFGAVNNRWNGGAPAYMPVGSTPPYFGTMAFRGTHRTAGVGTAGFAVNQLYIYGKLLKNTTVLNRDFYNIDWDDGTAVAWDSDGDTKHKYFSAPQAPSEIFSPSFLIRDSSDVGHWNTSVAGWPYTEMYHTYNVTVTNVDPIININVGKVQFSGVEFDIGLSDSRDPENNHPTGIGDIKIIVNMDDDIVEHYDSEIDLTIPVVKHTYYETRNPIDTPFTPQFDVEAAIMDRDGLTAEVDGIKIWTTQNYCKEVRKVIPMSPFLSITISQTSTGYSITPTTYFDKDNIQSTIAGSRKWRINGVHLAPMSLYSGFTDTQYADMAKYESGLFRLLFKYGVIVIMEIFGEDVIGCITNYSSTPRNNDRLIDYGMTFTEINDGQEVYGRNI